MLEIKVARRCHLKIEGLLRSPNTLNLSKFVFWILSRRYDLVKAVKTHFHCLCCKIHRRRLFLHSFFVCVLTLLKLRVSCWVTFFLVIYLLLVGSTQNNSKVTREDREVYMKRKDTKVSTINWDLLVEHDNSFIVT